MNRRLIRAISTAAALAAALSLSAPAFAGGHGHGNAGGGRGGYSMARGGAPAGGRTGMAAHGRSAGFSAPRASAPVSHGGRFGTPGARFNSSPRSPAQINHGARVGTPGARFSSGPRSAAPVNHAGRFGTPGARFDGRAGFRAGDHSWRPGFNRPIHGIGVGARPRYWHGGYFHGHYWPRAHYHQGFVRFITVLPAFYSTYWFAGIPYYYWDDTYYTWSPAEYGYIATDPPPAVDDDASDSGSAETESSDSSSIYVYPKNGQSEEQTSTDRYECHQWAAGQTGFDPTKGADQSAGSSGPDDYRRAMIACLDARGYSAR